MRVDELKRIPYVYPEIALPSIRQSVEKCARIPQRPPRPRNVKPETLAHDAVRYREPPSIIVAALFSPTREIVFPSVIVFSGYVPEKTKTVSPGFAAAIAAPIVV